MSTCRHDYPDDYVPVVIQGEAEPVRYLCGACIEHAVDRLPSRTCICQYPEPVMPEGSVSSVCGVCTKPI